MSDIFISYSRADKDFAEWLRDALQAAHRTVWVDLKDIPPSSPWRMEIEQGIVGADAVICVLSQDYLTSAACAREVEFALANNKRLIPVMARDVPHQDVAPPLSALNWIFFRPNDPIERSMQLLFAALDTDLDYVKYGTRLLTRAKEWTAKDRNPSFTLRGKDLIEAEQWLAGSGGKVPPPSQEQTQYLFVSRKVNTARQRTTIGALTAGIIITLILALTASLLFAQTKILNTNLTTANNSLRADLIAGKSGQQLVDNQVDSALLLAKYGYDYDLKHLGSADLAVRNGLFNALSYSPNLETVLLTNAGVKVTDPLFAAQYAQDGKTFMLASESGKISIWDGAKNRIRNEFSSIDPAAAANDDKLVMAAYSGNGNYVVTDDIANIQLWDAAKGTNIATLPAPFGDETTLQSLTFSPDSMSVAAMSCTDLDCQQNAIAIWSLSNPNAPPRYIPVPIISTTSAVFNVLRFSPNGKLIALAQCPDGNCSTSQLVVCNVATGVTVGTVSLSLLPDVGMQGQVNALSFSPDGKTIAFGGSESESGTTNKIFFWDVARQQVASNTIVHAGGTGIATLAYSADGMTLIEGETEPGRIDLWNLRDTPAILQPYTLRGPSSQSNAIAVDPDNEHFITAGEDGGAFLWRMHPYSALSNIYGDSTAVSPDGSLSASSDEFAHQITIRKRADGSTVQTIQLPADPAIFVSSLAFSPDGKTLAGGFPYSTIRLWSVASGQQIGDPLVDNSQLNGLAEELVTHLAFSRDGSYLLASDFFVTFDVWQVSTHVAVETLNANMSSVFYGFDGDFSPDGNSVIFGNGTTDLQTLDLRSSGSTPTTLLHSTGAPILTARYSHNGSMLATLDSTGAIQLWNALTHKPLGQAMHDQSLVTNVPNLAFSPDDSLLVSSHDHSITVWHIQDRTLYLDPIAAGEYVFDAWFSLDGKDLYSAINNAGVVARPIHARRLGGGGMQHRQSESVTRCVEDPAGRHCSTPRGERLPHRVMKR